MSAILSAFSGTGGLYASAIDYHDAGFSVIPCGVNKRPTIEWTDFQNHRASFKQIDAWFSPRNPQRHPSIGFVLGKISQNVVAIDLDGIPAMKAFYAQFPDLSGKTLTVLSGSGEGCHLYFQVEIMPQNINVRVENVGGFEIRGNGQYVIAPPSPHPSGNRYKTVALRPIAKVADLEAIHDWFHSMRESIVQERSRAIQEAAQPVHLQATGWKQNYLHTVLSQELARVQTANKGNRNNSLFQASLKLANYCAGGELQQNDCESLLMSAARGIGMASNEAQRTIASGFNIGWKYPKTVPPPEKQS